MCIRDSFISILSQYSRLFHAFLKLLHLIIEMSSYCWFHHIQFNSLKLINYLELQCYRYILVFFLILYSCWFLYKQEWISSCLTNRKYIIYKILEKSYSIIKCLSHSVTLSMSHRTEFNCIKNLCFKKIHISLNFSKNISY